MYLHYREPKLPEKSRAELIAALAAMRGTLNLIGAPSPLDHEESETLRVLTAEDLLALLESLSLDQLEARLERFLRLSDDSGGDVSLIEPEEDREAALELGQELLLERHDIESQLEGVQWFLSRRKDLLRAVGGSCRKLRRGVARLDERWKSDMQHFLVFNPFRRSYRALFDDMKRFWWWHLRADCDLELLYRLAEGKKLSAPHVNDCTACSTELRALTAARTLLRVAPGMEVRHPEPETLIELYEGELEVGEEERLDWHVSWCSSCHSEIEALERADEAERSLEGAGIEGLLEETETFEEDTSLSGSAVFYRVHLPEHVELSVSADRKDGVKGLPGERVYGDEQIEVWMDVEGESVLLQIFADKPDRFGALQVTNETTLESHSLRRQRSGADWAVFELGTLKELERKQLQFIVEYEGRSIELPCLDFVARKKR